MRRAAIVAACVAVMGQGRVHHVGPPAGQVPRLMAGLLSWIGNTADHPLVTSSVFHYEFEFIHPFDDGNGRLGRLWQTLILTRWKSLFAHVPVESLVPRPPERVLRGHPAELGGRREHGFRCLHAGRRFLQPCGPPQEAPPGDPPKVGRLLSVLDGEMSLREILHALGTQRPQVACRQRYLLPALQGGYLEMTRPDAPQRQESEVPPHPAGGSRVRSAAR